ncbi:MAG: Rdx family protein [Acidobacteriota bacterium]|nr:MAG: Rdx family protein [Acidobacteriota bacterium]
MTEALLNEFKRNIKRLELVPSDGGRFEVSLNGELVYSKLQTGEFPKNAAIVKEIKKRR